MLLVSHVPLTRLVSCMCTCNTQLIAAHVLMYIMHIVAHALQLRSGLAPAPYPSGKRFYLTLVASFPMIVPISTTSIIPLVKIRRSEGQKIRSEDFIKCPDDL